MRGVTKKFPGVLALDGVDFDCAAGEVHALLGENGAGKTTLMNILGGLVRADKGTIRINGRTVETGRPSDCYRLGIGFIHQESNLLPYLTVCENIFLGREITGWGGRLKRPEMRRMMLETAQSLGYHLNPDVPLADLSLPEQQLVEITRSLLGEPHILIMDEPTAALAGDEVQRLFGIMRALKARGVGIIYITHRLDEVLAVADRVTILKDGRLAGVLPRAELTKETMIRLMVGRTLSAVFPPKRRAEPGSVIVETDRISVRGALREVSFSCRAGEILGLGGLEGQGQRTLVRALFGDVVPEAGTVKIQGRAVPPGRIFRAIRAGLGYVPHDRRGEGLVLGTSIRHNAALASLWLRQRLGFIRMGRELAAVSEYSRRFDLKCRDLDQEVQYLSGGNQQKVVLARWLMAGPRALIFDEPTKGIDVGTKVAIYRLLRDLADQGMAVILLTSDMMELLGLSDRILVFYEGRISAEFSGEETTEQMIMRAASGLSGEAV